MIIYELTDEEKLNNHMPEPVWQLSRNHEVFIRDHITGELIQVLDCTEGFTERTTKMR